MYKRAASIIAGGLSGGARWVLGLVAALFGFVMIGMAPRASSPLGFVAFGCLCLAIALACCARGRMRQFIGSAIASAILGLCAWYAASEFGSGPLLSSRRSEPSLWNAVLVCVFFGLPSARYLFVARFGLARRSDTSAVSRDTV